MKLPPHHQRRLRHWVTLLRFAYWLQRNPRLAVAPPERCRTYVLAALAAQAGAHRN
jgi:hypothetical protein